MTAANQHCCSRKIERRLHEDLAFRMLGAGSFPKHRTMRDFRALHLKELGDLFVQVVKLAREMGLVKLGTVAIDGTKIKASVSRHKAMELRAKAVAEARERLAQRQRDADIERGRSHDDDCKPHDEDGNPKGGRYKREFGVPGPRAQDNFTDPGKPHHEARRWRV